ncbi:MAG TPA: BadF/BadG/BcrA/BcrD ATPase family protein [Ktedonobacteraceae bacterium]|nr:BadF/BadG/BcrA/BcrD ATPase family protein [Ktedonobacteraceae bacterium]
MECVLAVDGGNTKTVALVATLDGKIVGAGRGGCGDIYNAGFDGQGRPLALPNIEYAVTSALQVAQVAPSDLVTSVFSMAGADWPEDFTFFQVEMKTRGFGRTILIQNDAMGVLHAGSSDNVGVSVVCGTGAAVGARGPDGRVWHSSFWQIDTHGSEQLSRKMLNAVFLSELGIEEPTTLKGRILDFFGMETVEDVLYHMTCRETRRNGTQHHVHGLTPILLDEAEAGDAVARRIVQQHGRALGNYAVVAAQRVGIEGTPFTLVLAGGVLRHPSSVLPEAIIERVRETSPEVHSARSRFEPVIGVLFSALEAAGVTIDDELLGQLIPTIPDAVLFETLPPHPQ